MNILEEALSFQAIAGGEDNRRQNEIEEEVAVEGDVLAGVVFYASAHNQTKEARKRALMQPRRNTVVCLFVVMYTESNDRV